MWVLPVMCVRVADWPAAGGSDRYLICSPALRGPAAITALTLSLGPVLLWSRLPGVLLMSHIAGLVASLLQRAFR